MHNSKYYFAELLVQVVASGAEIKKIIGAKDSSLEPVGIEVAAIVDNQK